MPQFRAQKRGLHGIQPTVVTLEVVVILRGLSMVAQHPDSPCHGFVASGDRSGLSTGTEVLAGVEAEGRGLAERARPARCSIVRPVFCSMRLAGILDDKEVVLRGDRKDRVHVSRLTIQVHG